jgi:energy-coupling factor transporter ATP-binding protein EcfA2
MAIARSNIKKISIQNFKFFQQPIEFNLTNGNHLLLYGENGSGKSSLYWALYTILECANKENVNEIKKYFDFGEDEKLTNLFLNPANPDWVDSEILLELEDNTQIKVSLADTSINTDNDAQSANYASEFLNYKMIFQLHNFSHSDDVDIFNYFQYEVLPYIKFAPVKYWTKNADGTPNAEKETENAKQIWDFVKLGPPKTGKTKRTLVDRYPIRREPDFGEYINIINGFETELKQLLTFINTEGNPILADFGYDFTFKLELQKYHPLKLTELQFEHPKFAVKLSIPNFYGQPGTLKPHTFLNEARLSALGLAIRFAILKKRLQDAKLKLAILDDFMISLDMKNRDVAMDYILDKIAPNYQLLILTHDFYLYELAKDKINRKAQPNWVHYQMFEDANATNTNLYPLIIKDEGKVNKARELYKQKDFSSSANTLRQGVEKFCRAYLTKQEQLGGDYSLMKLDGLITKVIALETARLIVPAALLQDLKDYKDRILNPSSHYDIETPLFSNELKKAIDTLEQIAILTGKNI